MFDKRRCPQPGHHTGCAGDCQMNRTIRKPSEPPAPLREATATVKRVDLWGNVIDTFKTEGEANGWRPEQGRML